MKIELTEKQFRRLLDLVYIGNWVLNSTRGDDRIREYDEVESTVFSNCINHGMVPLVESYQGELIPSRAFAEGGIHEAILAYEDTMFFEILAQELALRDMDSDAPTPENYDELRERMDVYLGEFEQHGTDIITEGGRSLTAHHSVLILDVLESVSMPRMDESFHPSENDHQLVHDLTEIWDKLSTRSMLEDWHDAEQIREEALQLFSHGIVDLKTRAEIEAMYWSVCHEINNLAKHMKHVPEELRGLDKILADKYFCNFSLFQSLPDSWAIDQLFPIMPIQRLDERPTRNATLQDITCDSDGKIANFVTDGHIGNVLPLHPLKKNEPYYLGVFLVGAYQEILGDMHNLFGDTNAAHISVKDGKYSIDQIFDGETVEEVLDYVQYNPKKLVRQLEQWVTKSVKEGKISLDEGKEFLGTYRNGLFGYTYLQ